MLNTLFFIHFFLLRRGSKRQLWLAVAVPDRSPGMGHDGGALHNSAWCSPSRRPAASFCFTVEISGICADANALGLNVVWIDEFAELPSVLDEIAAENGS